MELEGVDKLLYKKGLNKELDRKFAQYKKKNIWAGDGHLEALTDIEVKILGKLWRKERMTPGKIQTQEVIKLVDLTRRIDAYRKVAKREASRIRKERERRKREEASKGGDVKAKRKLESIKKKDRKRAEKYRRKQKDKQIYYFEINNFIKYLSLENSINVDRYIFFKDK